MYKFSRTLHNRQLIQFARIPFEFVVRFIRYENRVKVITFSIALISPYSWCSHDLRLQCLELHTACSLLQYHWDKEFHFPGKFHFLFKTITDSVRLGVVDSNIVLRTANRVMFCEINLQSAAHITTIHNPRPTIYLFISFSIFFNRSSILDPRFPVNLEVFLIKIVLFLTTEFITFSKVIREPPSFEKALYAISILWTCSAARRMRDSQVQSYPNRHVRHKHVLKVVSSNIRRLNHWHLEYL